MSVNKAILIGRLGKDPEARYTQSGTCVCNFSMATGRSYKDKQTGEKVEITQWHNITAFGKLAEVCAKYLSKGSQAYINGEINYEQYEKDGQTKYITKIIANEVQFLDSKEERKQAHSDPFGMGSGSTAEEMVKDEFDDDIPF